MRSAVDFKEEENRNDDDDDANKDDDNSSSSNVNNNYNNKVNDTNNNVIMICSNGVTTTTTLLESEKELHIAPMLDFSKREFRKLFSILSSRVCLWTDMIVDETIAYSKRLDDLLGSIEDNNEDNNNNKYVCQIGGNSPELCGDAIQIVLSSSTTNNGSSNCCYNYDEINLNMDCPSNRVSNEREFGAVLMKKVDVAYKILERMQEQLEKQEIIESEQPSNNQKEERKINKQKHVSIKCRIGVDDYNDSTLIYDLIERLEPVCKRFYIHARTCILDNKEFNARKNRSIPPLNYPRVYDLCYKFPNIDFWINGGIRTLYHAKQICYGNTNKEIIEQRHSVPCTLCSQNNGSSSTQNNGSCTVALSEVPCNLRGCMMGRAAIDNPALFWDVDRYFYGMESNPCRNRREVLEKYCTYLEQDLYPRRCCDTDDRMTYEIPVPIIPKEKRTKRNYCPICQSIYGQNNNSNNDDTIIIRNNSSTIEHLPNNNNKIKFASRIMGRALKPVRNMFSGLPGGRTFF